MKIKLYISAVLTLLLSAVLFAPDTHSQDSEQSREYQLKAAFIYNFIQFVDWPEDKVVDSNDVVTIGIVGKDPFGKSFEPIQDKKVKDKTVVIKHFRGFEELRKGGREYKEELNRQIETLRKCHLVFICSSENENLSEIIEALKGSYVLTVGETAGFLEAGGAVNFLMEEKKVRFEVNLTAVEKEGFQMRSKLLRLAKRVIEDKSEQEDRSK